VPSDKTSTTSDKQPLTRLEFRAMGSPCEIRVYAENAEPATRAIQAAVAEINRLEQKYSRFKPDNFVARVNTAAMAGTSIAIDHEVASLLAYANTCFEQSDGLFDITSGALRRLWNFSAGAQAPVRIPSSAEIDDILARIGWQHVSWTANELRFAKAGMEIDFGGIVKEYAADCAANVCRQNGICSGMVDMGGDIHVIGPRPDGTAWQIFIRHPREAGKHIASFSLAQGALASSGDYERHVMIDGRRYCHILSPKTGFPISGMAAVSVVAGQCIVAGSACTIAMLKEREGPQWLAELGLPHVWCDESLHIGGKDFSTL
jgi:thiamine biosynthesis lipoprotein